MFFTTNIPIAAVAFKNKVPSSVTDKNSFFFFLGLFFFPAEITQLFSTKILA